LENDVKCGEETKNFGQVSVLSKETPSNTTPEGKKRERTLGKANVKEFSFGEGRIELRLK